ncbi:MAG TPA: hypothetical protein DDY98_03605, partial [Ruminococcaceae bacterium]|nr:hypothetical protein [Oscillospiraceae bacterium]
MRYDFSFLSVQAQPGCEKVAELFGNEIELRTGLRPFEGGSPSIRFCTDASLPSKDCYRIEQDDRNLTFTAQGIRGLIYAYSLFLRKCVFHGSRITLTKNLDGFYEPDKRIRGHQCGYRTCPNTYDAWGKEEYARFYLDIMAFGCNTCEHIPTEPFNPNNPVMKYNPLDVAVWASELADEVDLDVSCWYPNEGDEEENEALALERRSAVLDAMPRIDAIFPPGGDPGEMDGDAFIKRCVAFSKLLKEKKPNAQMWPSAQAPHSKPTWAEDFLHELNKLPDEIDGVIMGPNHAFPLDEMRRKVPMKYPIRFYPDITHNVRCEYPVHFERDDWHYALASTLSRESVNPRPTEFRMLHRLTRPYLVGSVSYSEGVNDDVNKAVWSNMDFFPEVSLNETLCDYARFFLWQADAQRIADGIFGLERNWEGDPAENPHIESTLKIFEEEAEHAPELMNNWRFVLLLFRARCDAIVRRRRVFELGLIDEAKTAAQGDFAQAKAILKTDFEQEYYQIRASVGQLADRLFEQIGIQLDVENYGASGWERGATLDTVDRPITDRAWLLNRFDYADTLAESEQADFLARVFNRNKLNKGEYYFSLAEHGFHVLGERQEGEFYMDFQGDRAENNGSMPMCILKAFDHFRFAFRVGGFEAETDYKLRVTFKRTNDTVTDFTVKANGHTIHHGGFFGGEADEQFDREMLSDRFISATYLLPAGVFENGCIAVE